MARKKEVVSKSLTFDNYSIKIAGGDQLKEIIRIGIPLVIGWFVTKDAVYAGLIALVGRFVITTAEFYIKDVKE